MKKIRLFSFLLIISLMFVGNVSAIKDLTCKYFYTSGRLVNRYEIKLSLNGDKSSVISVKYSYEDTIGGYDEVVSDKTETYKNSVFNVKEKGASCPKTITVTDKKIQNGKKKNGTQYEIVTGKDKDGNEVVTGQTVTTTGVSNCSVFTSKETCEFVDNQSKSKCVWNEEYGFCSVTGLSYLTCGDAKDIPPVVPQLTSYAVTLLKIVAPIILILVGIIELVKAMASNEDAMKKAQSKLIKKVVAAVMVFFVITIVQFVISKVADSSETGSIRSCLECFLNNECGKSTYYKDGYGQCYFLDGSESKSCDEI